MNEGYYNGALNIFNALLVDMEDSTKVEVNSWLLERPATWLVFYYRRGRLQICLYVFRWSSVLVCKRDSTLIIEIPGGRTVIIAMGGWPA
ncbi:hypothetical protein CDAR_541281 [Caerostris darwini]|uniref:Uncharacterized protein n=1 Tax=Caerostris darwini TaxID=1538125 RepID=A0AAV4TPW7_9ARAC|nr:hypothetical protein CDAR_541281 [Caerostris darwini]